MASVLLIEDEAEIAELIRDALTAEGLEVVTASTDIEAYGVLETAAGGLAALITDINLGRGTTGYDVARRARQLNGGLPVVYITSHDLHASRFGVEDGVLMLKPFLPSELALRVKGLIGPALDATEASRPIMGPGAGLALAPNGDAPDP
jgi:DNA-binding response OmpR family regulator